MKRNILRALILGGAVLALNGTAQAAPIVATIGDFGPGSTLITFTEVPAGTNGDGLTIGNVTFDWTGVGSITVASGGPGNTNNITQPALLSASSAGTLTIDFASPINLFGYGYAILDSGTVPNATTISLFDGATFLGSLAYTGVPDPTFPGGFAGVYSDIGFDRAVMTFAGGAFDLDNLRTAVPEPASLLLLGSGLAAVLARRRRA